MTWEDIVGQAVATVSAGPLLAAAPIALLAGLVSFASPCVLPLLPGYLGYLGGMVGATRAPASSRGRSGGGTLTRASRRRLLAGVLLFVLGFSTVFVGLGVVFALAGLRLAAWTDVILRVAGVLVILLGLAFVGAVPFLQRERRLAVNPRTAGLWGAPVLGVTFGLGWTPCIGPTLAAVLTLSFGGADPARGALLAAVYCLGLGLPFIVLALLLDHSTRLIGWLGRHARTLQIVGGTMLVVVGLALVTGLWGELMNRLQGTVAGFETIL